MIYSDDAVFMRQIQEFEARVSNHKSFGAGDGGLDADESYRVREACDVLYDAFSGNPPEGWVEKAADMVERLGVAEAVKNAVESVNLFARRGRIGRDKDWCRKEAFIYLYEITFYSPGFNVDDLYWFKGFPAMSSDIKTRVERMYDAVGVEDVPNDWIRFLAQLVPDYTYLWDYYPVYMRGVDFAADRGELPPPGDERAAFISDFYSIPPVATPDDEFLIAKMARDFSEREVGKLLAGERSYDEWVHCLRVTVANADIRDRFADKYDEAEIERFFRALMASVSSAEPCAALLWVDILPDLLERAGSASERDMLENVAAVSIDAEYREFGLNFVGDSNDAAGFWSVWSAPIRTAVRRRLRSELPYTVQLWDRRRGNLGDAAG